MEDLSPIYEDVDIRAWAQDIHLSKTRELEESIQENVKALTGMIRYFYPERYIIELREEINHQKEKLNILRRHEIA